MMTNGDLATMNDLDEIALKEEINAISKKIDAIMREVDRLYPPQPKPVEPENAAPEDGVLPPQSPTG